MSLTTLAIVKQTLNLSAATHDDVIGRIIRSVDAKIARYCRRPIERSVDAVEFPSIVGDKIALRHYPIESVSEIKQAADRDFDAATALVEGEDFMLDPDRMDIDGGTDAIVALQTAWYSGPGMIRVTYTGGYWTGNPDGDPGGDAVPAGAFALPTVLCGAATKQALHEFQHRTQFGERQINVGDMSVSQVRDGLLDIVRQELDPFVCMR